MRQCRSVIARLEFIAKPEQGLQRLEERHDALLVPVETDILVDGKPEVGGEQVQKCSLLDFSVDCYAFSVGKLRIYITKG